MFFPTCDTWSDIPQLSANQHSGLEPLSLQLSIYLNYNTYHSTTLWGDVQVVFCRHNLCFDTVLDTFEGLKLLLLICLVSFNYISVIHFRNIYTSL